MEREKYAYEDQSHHLNKLLKIMVSEKGTDLHVTTGSNAMIRIFGDLVTIKTGKFLEKMVRGLIFPKMLLDQIDELYSKNFISFPFFHQEVGQCQAKVFIIDDGLGFTIKVNGFKPKSFKDLGIPDQLMGSCLRKNGLILLSGGNGGELPQVTGSMVSAILNNYSRHVVLLERERSFTYIPKRGHVSQFVIGKHFSTTAEALYGGMQMDPDVIFVSDMNLEKDVRALIEALERGILIVCVSYGESSFGVFDKWINLVSQDFRQYIRSTLAQKIVMATHLQMLVNSQEKKFKIQFYPMAFSDVERNKIRNGSMSNVVFQAKSSLETMPQGSMEKTSEEVSQIISTKEEASQVKIPEAPNMAAVDDSEGPTIIRPESEQTLRDLESLAKDNAESAKEEEMTRTGNPPPLGLPAEADMLSGHETFVGKNVSQRDDDLEMTFVGRKDPNEPENIVDEKTTTRGSHLGTTHEEAESGVLGDKTVVSNPSITNSDSSINMEEEVSAGDMVMNLPNPIEQEAKSDLDESQRIKPETNVTQVDGGIQDDKLEKLLQQAKEEAKKTGS